MFLSNDKKAFCAYSMPQIIADSLTMESVVALALNEDIGTGDVSASLLKDEKVAAQIIVN
jgi:hypothetical protein